MVGEEALIDAAAAAASPSFFLFPFPSSGSSSPVFGPLLCVVVSDGGDFVVVVVVVVLEGLVGGTGGSPGALGVEEAEEFGVFESPSMDSPLASAMLNWLSRLLGGMGGGFLTGTAAGAVAADMASDSAVVLGESKGSFSSVGILIGLSVL